MISYSRVTIRAIIVFLTSSAVAPDLLPGLPQVDEGFATVPVGDDVDLGPVHIVAVQEGREWRDVLVPDGLVRGDEGVDPEPRAGGHDGTTVTEDVFRRHL